MLIEKTIQQNKFTGNLAREGNEDATMFFIIKKANITILYFLKGTTKVL